MFVEWTSSAVFNGLQWHLGNMIRTKCRYFQYTITRFGSQAAVICYWKDVCVAEVEFNLFWLNSCDTGSPSIVLKTFGTIPNKGQYKITHVKVNYNLFFQVWCLWSEGKKVLHARFRVFCPCLVLFFVLFSSIPVSTHGPHPMKHYWICSYM